MADPYVNPSAFLARSKNTFDCERTVKMSWNFTCCQKKMFQQWLNVAKMAKLAKMQYPEIRVS